MVLVSGFWVLVVALFEELGKRIQTTVVKKDAERAACHPILSHRIMSPFTQYHISPPVRKRKTRNGYGKVSV
jgi:hypothetical protein